MEPNRSRLSSKLANPNSPLRIAILVFLAAVLCYLSAKLGGALVMNIPLTVWPLWPGCATLVAILLLVPRRTWPMLLPAGLAGFVVYDLQAGLSISAIAWLILADIIEILIAAWGVSYALKGLPRLNSLKALAKYLFFTVFLASFFAASIGIRGISGNSWIDWKMSFLSEALAFLTVTPAILGLFGERMASLRASRARYLEAGFLVFALVSLSYLMFIGVGRRDPPALLYSLVPFLIWAALRFGSTGVGTSATIVAVICIWSTVHGFRPFAETDPTNEVLFLQLFLFFASLPFMVLAVLVEERKLAQEELRKSGERLRSAMQTGKAVGWEWDLKTGRDSWFGDLKTMYGLPFGTYVGHPEDFHRYVHPEDQQQVAEAVARARKDRKPYAAEFRVVWPNGTQRWVAASGKFYYSRKGEPERMLGMAVDITDRKCLEDDLLESKEQLRSIVSSAMDAIIAVNDTQRILIFNAAAERMFGCLAADAMGCSIDSFIPERFRAEYWKQIRDFSQTGATARTTRPMTELWGLRSNGREFPMEASISLVEHGGKMLFAVIIRDVTDRKLAEGAVKQSEEKYRRIVETANEGIWLLDSKFNTSFVNRQMTEMLGYQPGEMVGRSVFDFYFPEDVENKRQVLARRQDGLSEHFDDRFRRKDGAELWVRMAAIPIYKDKEEFDGALAMVSDITERKHAEEALRESEARFRLVANTAPVMIWMSNTTKLCTYFNTPWLDFTGRSLESELGNGWAEGVHPEDFKTCLETYIKAFDRREGFSMEYRLRRHDGEYRWVLDHGVPRFNQDGSFAGYIGTGIDVSDRKLAEEALSSVSRKLIEAQEQERLRIARELHDDIGQRLALMAVQLEQFEQADLGLPLEVRNRIGQLQKQSAEIASDVQSLSHELHSSRLEYLGITTAIRAFCKEFSDQQNVEVVFAHDEVPRKLPHEISLCLFRVLQEALQNAVKHSGVRHFDAELRVTSNEIELIVRDSGSGFDSEEARKSPGLGLVSMAERMKLIGGRLSIDTQPQRGTTICARVPLSKVAKASA